MLMGWSVNWVIRLIKTRHMVSWGSWLCANSCHFLPRFSNARSFFSFHEAFLLKNLVFLSFFFKKNSERMFSQSMVILALMWIFFYRKGPTFTTLHTCVCRKISAKLHNWIFYFKDFTLGVAMSTGKLWCCCQCQKFKSKKWTTIRKRLGTFMKTSNISVLCNGLDPYN